MVKLSDDEVALLKELRKKRAERRRKRNADAHASRRLGLRVSDAMATGIGSWTFILIQSGLLVLWMIANVAMWVHHWDPYPFILLNLALSFQAAFTAPIIMILSAAIVKALGIMPAIVEKAAKQFYLFVSKNLTWALLVGIGVCYTPWKDVVAVIQPSYIITVIATVLSMVGCGFFTARFLNMYPVESALVTACHSGLGGTGDVAILSASARMELMPFAQISTRIGGAAVVVMAVILMRVFYAG